MSQVLNQGTLSDQVLEKYLTRDDFEIMSYNSNKFLLERSLELFVDLACFGENELEKYNSVRSDIFYKLNSKYRVNLSNAVDFIDTMSVELFPSEVLDSVTLFCKLDVPIDEAEYNRYINGLNVSEKDVKTKPVYIPIKTLIKPNYLNFKFFNKPICLVGGTFILSVQFNISNIRIEDTINRYVKFSSILLDNITRQKMCIYNSGLENELKKYLITNYSFGSLGKRFIDKIHSMGNSAISFIEDNIDNEKLEEMIKKR